MPSDPLILSVARGSYLSWYKLDMGRINGWTLHNDVLVAQDQCLADSKNIVTEADLLAYILERQKALRVQAAAEHIERKAWALIGRKPG